MATSKAPSATNGPDVVARLTRLPEHGLGGRRKRRPERHDEILSAAVRLFHAQGYHETSVEDIAEAVGVSATAIYRHFHNKQEILDTASLWVGELLAQQLFSIDDSLGPERRLEQLVDDFVRTAMTSPNFVALLLREFHSLSPAAKSLSLERRQGYIDGFRDTLRRVQPKFSRRDAELRVHLAIALITSVTSFSRSNDRNVAETVKTAAMAALLTLP